MNPSLVHPLPKAHLKKSPLARDKRGAGSGAVAGLVGIEGGVVSGGVISERRQRLNTNRVRISTLALAARLPARRREARLVEIVHVEIGAPVVAAERAEIL